MFATRLQRFAYKNVAKPVFFAQDPEKVHDTVTRLGKVLGATALGQVLMRGLFAYEHPMLAQDILGIRFPNPIGLAAGFDKNAELIDTIPNVGFGFHEVGSITGEACEGNPKPRLWRLPKSRGLVVYYGLKNDGCEAIAERLRNARFRVPVGINVAKTNCAATATDEAGIADYEKAFRAFTDIGDYFTVNVSCPNAYGGEPFGDPARMDALLTRLDAIPTDKPVFVKLGADVKPEELDGIVEIADRHRVHGFILTNLTKRRDIPGLVQEELPDNGGVGGISGPHMAKRSNDLIAHLYRTAGDRFVIIGLGGVSSAEEAYTKIRLGASLVQLITGMIFEGPQLIGEINRGLVDLLRKDGFSSVSEAVGADHG